MRLVRRLADLFSPRALILAYHRVARLSCDPQLLCVTPERFAEHLAVLRRGFFPVRLEELTRSLARGRLAGRMVAVTFDDGYADNLQEAKPVLERFDVPATVFVCAGSLQQEEEFWWDDLERLVLGPGMPAGEGWNVLSAPAVPRHERYLQLYRRLKPLPSSERRQVLAELAAEAGLKPGVRDTHRALSRSELAELSRGGLVEIGAHTATHPVLSSLPAALQREEVGGGKARLEEILGRRVSSFAYPYGSPSDYTPETVGIVRQAGFERACANFSGLVGRGADVWQLPRMVVRDWSGEDFSRQLRGWLDG